MDGRVAGFDALFEGMASSSAEAAARLGRTHVTLAIAGRRIEIAFSGEACRTALLPALRHLVEERGDDGPPLLTVDVWDSASSGVAPPRPDWATIPLGAKGVIPGLSRPGGHAAFDTWAGVAQVYDVARGRAVYWTEDAARLPYWERSFPLRQTFAWFFAPSGMAPAHTACVAWKGRGILMPGVSGSGKSTTALRLGLDGFDLLGDDYVLIEGGPACRVWSLYRTAKLGAASLALLPEVAPHAHRTHADDEKAVVIWPTPAGGRMARDTTIAATVLPRVSGRAGPSGISDASPGDVVFALVPTTINHLDCSPAAVMSIARAAAEAAPAYRIDLGPDHRGLSEAVRALVGG